jgi:hypothetical protein
MDKRVFHISALLTYTVSARSGPGTESKKDIPMLGPLGSVTNSHWALANGKERYLFKELKCYE